MGVFGAGFWGTIFMLLMKQQSPEVALTVGFDESLAASSVGMFPTFPLSCVGQWSLFNLDRAVKKLSTFVVTPSPG